MSEIKVGEYVRTKKGFIAKVCAYQDLTTYDDKGISVTFHSFDTDKGEIADLEVAKYSSNIKELLGKDDYVNGYELQEFDDEEGNLYLGIPIYDDALMNCISEVRPLDTIEIKSIVTKEQFEKVMYKVGE